jgi:hypothetical protein
MKDNFQSRLFEDGFFKGDQLDSFKEDIETIKDINLKDIEKIIPLIKEIILADTEKGKSKLYEDAVTNKLVSKKSEILSFTRLSIYFYREFQKEKYKDEKIELIVKDISVGLNIKEEELSSISKFIELVKNEYDWYTAYKRQFLYKKGLVPSIKAVGTTVELRGVFNHEIEMGQTLSDYKKDLEITKEKPIIPLITVALTLDSGSPDRFVFQATTDRIDWLINELNASLLKIKLLEEGYKK